MAEVIETHGSKDVESNIQQPNSRPTASTRVNKATDLDNPPSKKKKTEPKTRSPNKGEKSKSRSGSPNYTKEELDVLFNIVEDILPMGRNHWAVVGDKFRDWAMENDSVLREAESLRSKFDKLAGAKKPTGEAEPPPEIMRAKEIARSINRKAAAVAIGDSSSDDEDTNKSNEAESEVVGSRRSAREPAATGTNKKAKRQDGFERVVESMANNIGEMTAVMRSLHSVQPSSDANLLSHSESEGITRAEVETIIKENMKPTNDMLANIMSLLQSQGSGPEREFRSPSGEERGSGGGAPSENAA